MPFQNYEMVLTSVLPGMRTVDAIRDDLTVLTGSGKPAGFGNNSEQQIAEIELRIAEGDRLARQRQYQPALNKFKEEAVMYLKDFLAKTQGKWKVGPKVGPAGKEFARGFFKSCLRIGGAAAWGKLVGCNAGYMYCLAEGE